MIYRHSDQGGGAFQHSVNRWQARGELRASNSFTRHSLLQLCCKCCFLVFSINRLAHPSAVNLSGHGRAVNNRRRFTDQTCCYQICMPKPSRFSGTGDLQSSLPHNTYCWGSFTLKHFPKAFGMGTYPLQGGRM